MQVCHFQHLLRQFDKNEPGRFLGEGVSFRAKLIGVLEVPEARGDRMCQEALADLKMAIRAAGEHKQRIQVHVAIDGLRLRDDKTGDSLYHHPVHKISFIAQDMTDSRAFGYIFGSPDTGHRFFGIKTDKAASQVVIAMRDLFQVVFELKKKEVEMAKQQLEGKSITSSLIRHIPSAAVDNKIKPQHPQNDASTSTPKEPSEGGVAELVDLEQELSSLRRGLTQVEGLTPSSDPFGDSFTVAQKGLLPPPPVGTTTRGRVTPASSRTIFSPTKTLPFDLPVSTDFDSVAPKSLVENFSESVVPPSQPAASSLLDVFTDLDPLGTGRSKPYVDKKLFFQELKNPPKKVLKDLVPSAQIDIRPVPTEAPSDYAATTTMTSLSRHSGGTVAIAKTSGSMFNSSNFFSADPFAETDPFDNADPFSDSFKDDPFTSMAEFGKASLLREEFKKMPSLSIESKSDSIESGKNVFNGPLQVTLPPEPPAPKSPRLQRHNTDNSSVRQRPRRSAGDPASPPPPLPPKKPAEAGRPPPPPPHERDDAPPIPKPSRKKEPKLDRTMKPRRASATTNSSSDEYLAPAPPPLPTARRFDITLSQLLTLSMDELSVRLRVPVATLSSMTLPQLTDYLRHYLSADNDRPHIHVETAKTERERSMSSISPVTTFEKPKVAPVVADFKAQFEDNFAPSVGPGDFVADFDDFEKKANASYDRYAAFREIQELELKSKSILDPVDSPNGDLDPQLEEEKDEPSVIIELAKANQEAERKEDSKSPLKSLDELTLDSFNMFRNSVSPKPAQIDAKIEDIKSVMKTLQIESSRRSVSPRENNVNETKDDSNDRYAALREITITEPPDEFESLPPDIIPKERKKSDEKSDGFDNSDFFDCIDNSSLSFTHVEDAFRKSPVVKEREERKIVEVKEVVKDVLPVRDLQPPPRLSAGSISDVASASSPDTKDKTRVDPARTGDRWSMLGASPWSSDSRDSDLCRPRRRHHSPVPRPIVASSSSSREVSPWEEEVPQRHHHHRDRDRGRESRHNSSGSRECLDSGSGREKDKLRDRRESRDRDSRCGRERKDSGSGRDRRDHKDYKEKRDKRSRERDKDIDRDRTYSRERDYRDSRSRERPPKDYREKEITRHVKSRHSYDEDEEYSDGCPSGRSSPRDRWPDPRWRRDERNYGSLGWRESRRRNETRPPEDPPDRRYTSTLGYSRRAPRAERDRRRRRDPRRDPRDPRDPRDTRDPRDPRDTRDPRDIRDPRDTRDPREARREPRDLDDKRNYCTLEGTRFSFDPEESTASPPSAGPTRSQWWWQSSDSPGAFEDDFTSASTPRHRNTSIAEEEESDLPPLRPKINNSNKDIKKSESVNIFTRECDPFEGDAFFACTGSDKAGKRENWPGDFKGFDHA